MKIRKCNRCGFTKFIISFSWANKTLKRRSHECWECSRTRRRSYHEQNRRYQLWHLYHVTLEQFNEMYSKQNGKCALCGIAFIAAKLCVDHDHLTKNVRSLLCKGCNMLVGIYESRFELLSKIPSYLNKANEKPQMEKVKC